ncbi:MAG: hypothetical protein E7Z89_07005 [Cyanobacteria bacterium SIG28]|nr:hypothetical protein [Cyanobacteria bacterium SIG28]
MTLYGELFDKEGETIWDELLYMLTHPELEEEKLRKYLKFHLKLRLVVEPMTKLTPISSSFPYQT